MRIDKFLSCVNIIKRRAIAQDMCDSGVVSINNIVAKSSRQVKVGDIIALKLLESSKSYQVLAIPTSNSIPKSKRDEYVRELN